MSHRLAIRASWGSGEPEVSAQVGSVLALCTFLVCFFPFTRTSFRLASSRPDKCSEKTAMHQETFLKVIRGGKKWGSSTAAMRSLFRGRWTWSQS